jgi:undecaprenyl-diphosphatase
MEELLRAVVEWVVAVDTAVAEGVADVRRPFLTKVMNSVSGLGSATAGLAFVGLFYLADWRREFRVTVVALAITGVVVATLMFTVRRPYPPKPVCATGGAETVATSFPSGHAAAVAVYATVARHSRQLPVAVVAPGALLIAVSRVYLGTHYLSDTVVGVAIGIGTVLLAERLLDGDHLEGVVNRWTDE